MDPISIVTAICQQSQDQPHSPVVLLQLGVSSEEALDAICANLEFPSLGFIAHRTYKTALPIAKHKFMCDLINRWALRNFLTVADTRQLFSDGLLFTWSVTETSGSAHDYVALFTGVKAAPLETQVLLFSIYWRAFRSSTATDQEA